MIRLIATCEPARLPMLPQFVHNYARQGVDDFILSLQLEPSVDHGATSRARAQADDIARKLDIRPLLDLRVPFDAMALRTHHDVLQSSECSMQDWIVWADVDEFHWFGAHLREICADCDSQGHDAVRGQFVDRVARAGELPPFDPERSIWSQFPIGCDVTSSIVEGMSKKVVLARARVRMRHANHDPLRHQRVSWSPIRAPIFHFKWDASVLPRLQARLEPDWKERCAWWTQSAAAISAIDASNGRIPIERLRCFDFHDDDYPTEYFPYETNRRYREQWIHWQTSFPHPSE